MKPSLARFLLDLFYPPKCIYCDKLLTESDVPACPDCTKRYFALPIAKLMQQGEHFAYCVSAALYEDAVRRVFLQYKFEGEKHLAKSFVPPLAQAITRAYGEDFDCITWIPVSAKRLKERGYDQARLLADGVARELGRTAVPLLTHPKPKPAQSTLTGFAARRENVRDCFAVPEPETVRGQCVLLIDDVMTTGATLEEASKVLWEAGAREILCATLCRTPEHAVKQECGES